MSKYSSFQKLIIMIISLTAFLIPGSLFKASADKKREEENKKRAEEQKRKAEEEDRKFKEDKNNIANTIDQSIYDKVDFTDDPDDGNTNKIVKWLNTYVIPKLVTPEYKKSMIEAIEDYGMEKYGLKLPKGYCPKVHAKNFSAGQISIIDDEQEVNVACSFVVNDIADILRKVFGHKVSTGDGDEGCVYLD